VELSKAVREKAIGVVEDFSDEMLGYAISDVEWALKLWHEKVAPYWPEHEQRIAELTERSGNRGVKLNLELLDEYIETLKRSIHANCCALPWYPERPPTSPKGLAEECRKLGIACPPTKTADEDGYYDWENQYIEKYPWVAAVSRQRSLTKLLAKFELMRRSVRPDGTLSMQLRYFGAHTGRWSGQHVNLQNMRRLPLLIGRDWMVIDGKNAAAAYRHFDAEGMWPEAVAVAIDERALYVARPGHKLLVVDLAQIEPRVLNWLIDNGPFLEGLRQEGASVYEVFGRTQMGWSGGPLKKENKHLYALYKVMVLGLGYQAGAETFQGVARDMAGLELTEAESAKAVAQFRAANPLLSDPDKGLWATLQRKLKESLGGDMELELPSGRVLRYGSVRRSPRPPRIDKKTGELVPGGYQFTAIVGGRRVPTYGGKLTENVTQAVARDVFADGLLRAVGKGVPLLWTSHDEMVGEVPEDSAEATLAEVIGEFRKVPEWAAGLPTDAEGVATRVYLK